MSDVTDTAIAVLSEVTKLVKKLTEEQIDQLLSGKGKLVFLPPGHKVMEPLDLGKIAEDVRSMSSSDEVVAFLDRDKRLTAALLKELAATLKISLPSTAKTKLAIQRQIGESAIGFRVRSAAVLGGTWRS